MNERATPLTDEVDGEEEISQRRSNRGVAAAFALVAVALLVVVPHVVRYRTLSPIDELTHVDYLFRISNGSMLRQGDLLGQDAMRELSCRRIDDVYEPPPCRSGRYDPQEFGHIKESGAAQHPPLYYALTAYLGRGLQAATGLDSLVDAGRLIGALWLAGGLILFWYAGGRLRISQAGRIVVAVLIATTPVVVHASTTVNNDASALAAGAVLAVLAVGFEQERVKPWVLILGAALVVLAKSTNIVGVAGTAVFLGIRAVARRGERAARDRLLWGSGALLAGAVVSVAGWLVVRDALARAPTSALVEFHQVGALQVGDVLGQAFALVTPVVNPHLPPFLQLSAVLFTIQLVNLAFIAGSFGGMLGAGRPGPPRGMGVAAALAMVLGGIAFTLINYFVAGVFFPIPPRYGLSLLPILGLALGAALERLPALLTIGALAAVSAGVYAYGLIWGP